MRLDKRLLGQVRRAVQDFNMIREGDKIAVGVSGGKDSVTLLVMLKKLQSFYPVRFELEAVTLDLGMGSADYAPIRKLCAEIGVNYTLEETLIGRIVFEARQEKNPCSLCANLRRGALNNLAVRLGCNKVALAHHRDDVIETLLMSTFYEGRIHTFSPVTRLDRKGIDVIRPLVYAEEKDIRGFIKAEGLVTVPNPCKADGKTTREHIKKMIKKMSIENKEVRSNIFGAILRSSMIGWHTGSSRKVKEIQGAAEKQPHM